MRLSSLRPLLFVALASLAPTLGACWVEPDQPYVSPGAQPTPTAAPTSTVTPVAVDIATGETLASDAGSGAGVFVEYHGGGQWRVWTTCDTARTGAACGFHLNFQPEEGALLKAYAMEPQGESDNRTDAVESRQITVQLTTSNEIDGVQFQVSPPGAALRLEALLDNIADSRIIFWVGPDVLHTGAPTDPVIFVPTKP